MPSPRVRRSSEACRSAPRCGRRHDVQDPRAGSAVSSHFDLVDRDGAAEVVSADGVGRVVGQVPLALELDDAPGGSSSRTPARGCGRGRSTGRGGSRPSSRRCRRGSWPGCSCRVGPALFAGVAEVVGAVALEEPRRLEEAGQPLLIVRGRADAGLHVGIELDGHGSRPKLPQYIQTRSSSSTSTVGSMLCCVVAEQRCDTTGRRRGRSTGRAASPRPRRRCRTCRPRCSPPRARGRTSSNGRRRPRPPGRRRRGRASPSRTRPRAA